jgi:RHS repeat-associated protein
MPIDTNGNLATKTEGSDTWTYTWNSENQLIKVERNGAEVARFAYDPVGRRVEKVAGAVTTGYTYDGAALLREMRGSTTLRYVQGLAIDEPLAIDNGASLSYVHVDGLGSIVRMTSATGLVTLMRQYDAWGNLETGATEPGYAFTGREWHPETNLHYYRARYYDSNNGHFLSDDPVDVAARTSRELNGYLRSR